MSYFRWRQAPFAQEQMHAGLLRPDSTEAEGFEEARQVALEIAELAQSPAGSTPAQVAIVFDYPSAWAWQVQPQGKEFDYFRIVFDTYRALRRLGLTIDIVPATSADLSRYRLVAIPALFAWNDTLLAALRAFDGLALVGPRTGSKTADFAVPASLPPGLPADLLDAAVSRVETLPADCPVPVGPVSFRFWRELVVPGKGAKVVLRSDDGWPALIRQGNIQYMAGWGDDQLLMATFQELAEELNIPTTHLPDGVRIRRNGGYLYAINYGDEEFDLAGLAIEGEPVLGKMTIGPSGVTILRLG